MTEAKNPLVKLRATQGMTCYNGYITEMNMWATKEQFVASCVRHEEFRGSSPRKKLLIQRLAGQAWDWWFQL